MKKDIEFIALCHKLTSKIKNSYESGVTMEEAERLAGEFLYASLKLAEQYREADLDSRMKKTGLKAVKAAVYLDEVSKVEKKPSDALLQAKVDTSEEAIEQQKLFDEAEVQLNELKTYLDVFKDAHIHYRNIARGTFSA